MHGGCCGPWEALRRAGKDEQPRFALKPKCFSGCASHTKGPHPCFQGCRSESTKCFFAPFNIKRVLCSFAWLPGISELGGNETFLGLTSLFLEWGVGWLFLKLLSALSWMLMKTHSTAVVSWVPLDRLSSSAWAALNIPKTAWWWLYFPHGRADEKVKAPAGRLLLPDKLPFARPGRRLQGGFSCGVPGSAPSPPRSCSGCAAGCVTAESWEECTCCRVGCFGPRLSLWVFWGLQRGASIFKQKKCPLTEI